MYLLPPLRLFTSFSHPLLLLCLCHPTQSLDCSAVLYFKSLLLSLHSSWLSYLLCQPFVCHFSPTSYGIITSSSKEVIIKMQLGFFFSLDSPVSGKRSKISHLLQHICNPSGCLHDSSSTTTQKYLCLHIHCVCLSFLDLLFEKERQIQGSKPDLPVLNTAASALFRNVFPLCYVNQDSLCSGGIEKGTRNLKMDQSMKNPRRKN